MKYVYCLYFTDDFSLSKNLSLIIQEVKYNLYLIFVRKCSIYPMNGDASALFHATEPGHLALGKLVDGYLQLAVHLVVGQLADAVEGDVLVLQAVAYEALGGDGLQQGLQLLTLELAVFQSGEVGNQTVGLEHEARVLAPKAAQLVGLHVHDVLAQESDRPRIGRVQPRRDVEKGGLTRARFARDGDELSLLYGQGRAVDRRHHVVVELVLLDDGFTFQNLHERDLRSCMTCFRRVQARIPTTAEDRAAIPMIPPYRRGLNTAEGKGSPRASASMSTSP